MEEAAIKPILTRFGHWAEGVAHGDLGKTIEGDDVNDDFGRRVGVSTRLLLLATIVGSIGGVALGAFGAIRQYRLFDRFTTLASFFVLAMPVFVIGVALKIGATALNDGTQTIKVKPGTPIVTFAPGDRADAKVGAKVFLGATKGADGSLTAARLLVGKDGLTPPM